MTRAFVCLVSLTTSAQINGWVLQENDANIGKILLGIFRHEILSLKVPNVKFDFHVSDCMIQVVTDTSKISMRPYHSVQMSNLMYYLDVLFVWLQ